MRAEAMVGRLAVLAVIGAANQDIWLTSIQPFTGADWDAGISMRIGAQIMLEEVNSNPSLLPGYTLKVAWQDGLCAKPVGTNIFLQNLFDKTYKVFAPGKTLAQLDADKDGTVTTADTQPMEQVWTSAQVSPDPIGLLGSGCAGTALNIANVAYKARFPMISNSATRPGLSDRSAYPNFFRTILPDTFFTNAWLAMAKLMNQTSVTTVIGETENWASMGIAFAQAANNLGVTMVGHDLSAEMSGLKGLQISIESQSAAKDVASELVSLEQRVVVLMMFHKRNRLVLCEAYKKEYLNAVYMVMGWLPFGWWEIADTDCTTAQITSMANHFISANMMFWRTDMTTKLSCAQSMTAKEWQTEWFSRQGRTVGDLSKTPEGYALALEATTTADAVCMYAQMLHQILVVKTSVSLADLAAHTPAAYTEIFNILTATDFEGMQGRVRFAAGSADPKGSIIVQQLHASSKPHKIADICSYTDGVFNFLGQNRLKFQFTGEDYSTGPAGATSIVAPLKSFRKCPAGKSIVYKDNSCVDCAKGTVFLASAGACVCQPGFSIATATGSAKCGECAVGTFAGTVGKLTCDKCEAGKFANVTGQTSCHWCNPGKYSPSEGGSKCVPTNRTIWLTGIQPFTGADWDAGISMRVGAEIMLEEVNKHSKLLSGFELKVVWQDGLCAKPVGTNLFLTNIFDKRYDAFAPGKTLAELDVDKSGRVTTSDTKPLNQWWDSSKVSPDPVGLLGSGCAGTAINIVNIAYMARFPMISNSATRPSLSDRSKFPNFWRTIMPDTFFNGAWIAMAKMLSQKEVACVIGETENWGSMGEVLAAEAKKAGVKLVGFDKSKEIAGFVGLQVSIDSQAAAKDVATELMRLKQRVVILLIFAKRNRLVLCEAFKQGYRNAVWMPMGWLAAGWYAVKDTDCSIQDLTSMAMYFISANMMMWREDANTKLSCAESMTMAEFKKEWFKRQGAPFDDYSMRPEGYALAGEASTTADAVCMWAQALHHMLWVRRMPLELLSARTKEAYDGLQDSIQAVDFQGVQGRVSYGPNEADPKGSIILQQQQPATSGGRRLSSAKLVDIARIQEGKMTFFGNTMKFQFPGEEFPTTKGANTVIAPLTSFKACPGGQSLNMVDNKCEPCPQGMVYLSIVGMCACKAGYANNASNKCEQCTPGKFTGIAGKQKCDDCPAGSFAKDIGATECMACGLGKYQTNASQSGCITCPNMETTIMTGLKSKDGCDCKEDTYRPRGANSPCENCLEGMTCPFGSNANNFKSFGGPGSKIPLLAPGYFSEPSKPLSIYKCVTEKSCPGGKPGSCKGSRESLVCATCPTSESADKKTGGCKECSGSIGPVVFISPLFICILIFITYYIGNSPLSANATITLTCSVAGGLIVTVFQVLAVFKQLSVPWPAAVKDLFDSISFFAMESEAVTIECAIGHDAATLYLFRILVPIAFVILVFFVFFVTKFIPLIIKTFQAWVLDKALNTIGQSLQMLFIAFAVIVVRPLECAGHPNGESSMLLYPQVLCFSSDHTPLLVLAILETLCFLLPFAGLCVWANIKAPKMSASDKNKGRFLVRFRFLMYRFRPDTWWWGNVYLLRQTLLAFATSVPANDPHGQVMYTASTFAVYLTGLCRYWPWKNHALNVLDAGSSMLMLLVITAATAFLPASPEKNTHVAFLMVLLTCLGVFLAAFLGQVAWNIATKGIRGEFGSQEIHNFTTDKLTSKWMSVTEVLLQLGHDRCEPMVRIMNRFDREAMLKALVNWEIVCSEFLDADQMSKMRAHGAVKDSRLANLPNSTSKVDVSNLAEDIQKTLNKKIETKSITPVADIPTNGAPKEEPGMTPREEPGLTPRIEESDPFKASDESGRLTPRGTPRLYGSSQYVPDESNWMRTQLVTPR